MLSQCQRSRTRRTRTTSEHSLVWEDRLSKKGPTRSREPMGNLPKKGSYPGPPTPAAQDPRLEVDRRDRVAIGQRGSLVIMNKAGADAKFADRSACHANSPHHDFLSLFSSFSHGSRSSCPVELTLPNVWDQSISDPLGVFCVAAKTAYKNFLFVGYAKVQHRHR